MKSAKSLLAGLFLIGSLGAINNGMAADHAMASDGVRTRDELTRNSYREQFPAMPSSASAENDPNLTIANPGGAVDFYRPRDEKLINRNELWQQKLDDERRWDRGYHD